MHPQRHGKHFEVNVIITKALFVSLGIFFLILGTIGIFLRLLPTTPFYLLASFFFAKGSKRFHGWLTGTKFYKKHIDSFEKNRSMTLKTKLTILVPVSLMMILTGVFVDILAVRVLIGVLILTKAWYFLFVIKTERD